MTGSLASELQRAGLAVPDGSQWTMYAISDSACSTLVLVLASDGDDAVAVCREDGFDWAATRCHVRRVHRGVFGERGVLDAFEVVGGFGNSKGTAVEMRHGVEVRAK